MEKFFEGKRVIDLEAYNEMSADEKKEIEAVVSEGETIKTIKIDGEQYQEIQLPDSEKSFLVSTETRQSVINKYVYEKRMRELIEKIRNRIISVIDAAIEFYSYSQMMHISREQIDKDLKDIARILDRKDFENFMYMLRLNVGENSQDASECKINFEEYISLGVFYQKITEEIRIVALKSQNPKVDTEGLKGVRTRIRRDFEEKVDRNGGIISYTKDGIDVREEELIIDLVLETIAKIDVAERDAYVELLKKKLNVSYLTTLLNLELLSDDEIMTFYRTDWLGNKIEGAIQNLKPQDRRRLEARLEEPINEWVNLLASVNAWEQIWDEQFKSNTDHLPPRIKRRVLDRIEEVKREIIEQSKIGETEETSKKEEISIDTLLKEIIQSEGEEQASYIKKIKERGIKAEHLVNLINTGVISYEDVARLYEVKELSRIIAKAVAGLNLARAIRVYIASENICILNHLDWKEINAYRLKGIRLLETDISAPVIARIIVRMHQLRNITMSDLEISSIFADDDINDKLRAYFELVKNGLYHEDSIIALWNEKVNESNSENPYEQQESEDVTVEELLEFFNPDKVIAKMERYCNPNLPDEESKKESERETEDLTYYVGINEFLTFYMRILEGNRIKDEEKTKQIIIELESKLSKKIVEGMAKKDATYLLVAVQLLEQKVISTKNMQEILREENQEKLIEMYGTKIDDITLLSLYRHGLVQDYILELIYQDMDKVELRKKLKENSIGIEDTLILCALGILGKEQIKGIEFEAINWESLSTNLDKTKFKNLIELLYLNRNIGFEEIKKLKEMGILSAKEAEALTNQIDLEEILKKGLTSVNGEGVKGRTKVKERSKKREENGLPDREVLLSDLGFKPITDERGNVLVVAQGSFKGYKIYMDITGKYKVILLEKDMHASTFAMHKAKAGEFFREEADITSLVGSRSDWREKSRTDGSVIARKHTVNWGSNIIQTIVDIDSIFQFDDEAERGRHVKEETKRLCEENEESIEYLRLVKEFVKE